MISFIDLLTHQDAMQRENEDGIARGLACGTSIRGPKVTQLEYGLTVYTGAAHFISCRADPIWLQKMLPIAESGAIDRARIAQLSVIERLHLATIAKARSRQA